MGKTPKTGLQGLLRPEDSIVVLIDHQPYQFTNLNSHEPTMIINNVVGLAKGAKLKPVVINNNVGRLIWGMGPIYNRLLQQEWMSPSLKMEKSNHVCVS